MSTLGLIDPVPWSENYQLPPGIESPIASPRPSQQTTQGNAPENSQLSQIINEIAALPSTQAAQLQSMIGSAAQTAIFPGVTKATTTLGGGGAPSWFENLFNTAANVGIFHDTSTDPPLERIVAILLGLILVGAGLMMFRTTQTVIEHTTSAVKKGAELAAVAG